MNYTELANRLRAHAVVDPTTEPDWNTVALPQAIEAAEMRCFRDGDFLSARVVATAPVTMGNPLVTLPPRAVTVRDAWMRWPSATGGRRWLDRRDRSYMNDYWPDHTMTGTPRMFCDLGDGSLLVLPTSANTTEAELHLTVRPAGISASNPTNWLGDNYPDLLFFAAMVALAGYMKNYGAQADDPKMAMSWEAQYGAALAAVRSAEGRRKAEGYYDTASPSPPPPASTVTGA